MNSGAALAGEALRVVAAPAPALGGWVRCAAGAPYFATEAGTAWTPVGHNDAITWPNIGPLYRRRDRQAVDRHFAELAASGVTCLRLMLDYSQVHGRHLEHRVGAFSPAMVRLWDDLIALGERHAVRFLLTPFDTFFMARRWRHHPYAAARGGPCASPETMFTCPATRAAIIERLRFATRRWGASPAIFAWDLWNEIDAWYAGGDLQAVHDFVTEASAALREEEERLHGRSHLQTVSVFHPNLVASPALGEVIFRHPALDFASVHLYEPGTLDAPQSTMAAAEATARLMQAALAECPPLRPLLDTEHGPVHTFCDGGMTLPESFDTACFRRTQWAHLASGGAGGGMRWPYRHPHALLPAMHAAQGVLAGFLPLIDWQTFARTPLADRLQVHDFAGLAIGCGDAHQAILCLMRGEMEDAIVSRVEIAGMEPGRYTVTRADTVTGARETSTVHTRQDGTLVVLAVGGGHDIALAITPALEDPS
jgi:mannan endo-1,4-beta-mannosidase